MRAKSRSPSLPARGARSAVIEARRPGQCPEKRKLDTGPEFGTVGKQSCEAAARCRAIFKALAVGKNPAAFDRYADVVGLLGP